MASPCRELIGRRAAVPTSSPTRPRRSARRPSGRRTARTYLIEDPMVRPDAVGSLVRLGPLVRPGAGRTTCPAPPDETSPGAVLSFEPEVVFRELRMQRTDRSATSDRLPTRGGLPKRSAGVGQPARGTRALLSALAVPGERLVSGPDPNRASRFAGDLDEAIQNALVVGDVEQATTVSRQDSEDASFRQACSKGSRPAPGRLGD